MGYRFSSGYRYLQKVLLKSVIYSSFLALEKDESHYCWVKALQNPYYSYIIVRSFRLSSLNPTTLYQIYTYAKGLIYNTAIIPFLSQKVNLTCCKWITQYCASLVSQMAKNLPAMHEDQGLIPELGRYPGEGNGNPLQYSCRENSMDRGA